MIDPKETYSDQDLSRLEMVMHEIYTSLNSISSILESLSKTDFKSQSDFAKEKIDDASFTTLMLKNVLQYWTFSHNNEYYDKTPLADVDLWTPFSRPNSYFRRLIKKNGLEYVPKKDVSFIPAIKNAWPILYALPNIMLDNAIKYAPRDSRIDCFFEYSRDTLVIRMENDGPYLKESERESILELGMRGENARTSGKRGSGFGLALLNDIVSAHDGSISIESEKRYVVNGVDYGLFTCTVTIPME